MCYDNYNNKCCIFVKVFMRYSLKDGIEKSIKASKSDVFIRGDFNSFGGYNQVGRAIKEIADSGLIVKIGYGVYVRARRSKINGEPIPVKTLTTAGLELMKKLGVDADVCAAAQEYRSGLTTQIPMIEAINVGKSRITRKMKWAGRELVYERS